MNAVELNIAVGILMPIVVTILSVDIKNDGERKLFTFICCLVAGCIINYQYLLSGDIGQIVAGVGIVWATSQTLFTTYWKDSDLRATIQNKLAPSENNG